MAILMGGGGGPNCTLAGRHYASPTLDDVDIWGFDLVCENFDTACEVMISYLQFAKTKLNPGKAGKPHAKRRRVEPPHRGDQDLHLPISLLRTRALAG